MKSNIIFKPLFYIPLLIGCILLQRFHTYHESIDRDVSTYAVIAHEIIKGKSLYSGILTDQKPPAIFITYTLGELAFGYGKRELCMLGAMAASLFLLAIPRLRNFLSPLSVFYAAVFWTLVCSSLPLEANQPNTESFINLWMLFGLGFLLKDRSINRDWKVAVGAGICFAIASLYKHSIVIIPIMVSLAIVIWPTGGRSRLRSLNYALIIGIIGLAFWVGTFLYFKLTGRAENFSNWIFTHNRYYSGSITDNILNLSNYASVSLIIISPLFALSFVGLLIGFYNREYNKAGFLLFLAFGSAIAVALPGKYFPHYFQLWFPFLIVASGFAIDEISRLSIIPIRLRQTIPLIVIMTLVFLQYPFWRLTCKECSDYKFGYIFINTERCSNIVSKMLKPNETFYQIGDEPETYMYTGKSPIGPIAIGNGLSGPLASQISEELMKAVHSNPDLILVEKYAIPEIPKESVLWKLLDNNYTPIRAEFYQEPFYFLFKQGSRMEKLYNNQSNNFKRIENF